MKKVEKSKMKEINHKLPSKPDKQQKHTLINTLILIVHALFLSLASRTFQLSGSAATL